METYCPTHGASRFLAVTEFRSLVLSSIDIYAHTAIAATYSVNLTRDMLQYTHLVVVIDKKSGECFSYDGRGAVFIHFGVFQEG